LIAILFNIILFFAKNRKARSQHKISNEAAHATAHVDDRGPSRVLKAEAHEPAISLDPGHAHWGNHTRDDEAQNAERFYQCALL